MKPRPFLFALLLAASGLASAPAAHAQATIDRVRRQNGLDSGKITAITPLGVTISKGSVESTIPTEDIESIYLGGEPASLNAARNAIQQGKYQDAVEALGKIEPGAGDREEILAEIDFYGALARARLAIAGQGNLDAAAAGLRAFLSKRRTSFHIPAAVEALGDVLAAKGDGVAARTEYAKLALAKNDYFAMRSAWLAGKSWQADGDQTQAAAEFDKALKSPAGGKLADEMRSAISLDRAVSKAAAGDVEAKAAIATIAAVIAKAEPEDAGVQGPAYNALGDAYKASGDSEGALYAYLHVDLLYQDNAEAHAKALHELVGLWKSLGYEGRSQEAAAELMKRYPNSRWAKK